MHKIFDQLLIHSRLADAQLMGITRFSMDSFKSEALAEHMRIQDDVQALVSIVPRLLGLSSLSTLVMPL